MKTSEVRKESRTQSVAQIAQTLVGHIDHYTNVLTGESPYREVIEAQNTITEFMRMWNSRVTASHRMDLNFVSITEWGVRLHYMTLGRMDDEAMQGLRDAAKRA